MILIMMTVVSVLNFQRGTLWAFLLSVAVLLGFLFPVVATVIAGAIVLVGMTAAIIYKCVSSVASRFTAWAPLPKSGSFIALN